MTLASSGDINMVGPEGSPRRSISAEIGHGFPSGPLSLLDSSVLSMLGKSGGPVVMPTDFYGRSSDFTFIDTVSTFIANYNLRARAIAAGWDGLGKLIAITTVDSAGIVASASSASPAMTTDVTAYPSGSTWMLTNNGKIIGAAGDGGAGGTASAASLTNGGDGGAGGTALAIATTLPVTFYNNADLWGGGGGGGGGGAAYYNTGKTTYDSGGGGGGGGTGGNGTSGIGGAGGAAGAASGGSSNSSGSAGTPGSVVSNGLGGAGGSGTGATGGAGGAGGTPGSAGSAGTNGSGTGTASNAGLGGAAGYSITGWSNVNLVVVGTIYGPLL
jgi:hypothetical protein